MKICPDCQSRYDDDVDVCPRDGEELVPLPDELSGNPKLPEPASAAPADRTSMIDLEAIEAKRKQKSAQAAGAGEDGGDDGDDGNEKTPPPDGPVEVDRDATGTLHRSRIHRKGKKDPTRVGAPEEDGADAGQGADDDADGDFPSERRVNDELTDREMSRTGRSRMSRMSRTGRSRVTALDDTAVRDRSQGTATGMTRQTKVGTQVRKAGPKRSLTGTQAAFIALVLIVAVIGAIIFVARATAVLTVTTVPPGADVTLDGKALGRSPLQKRVRTGGHVVELNLDGYEPFKEVVQVDTGGLPFLQPLQKKPPPPPPPPSPAQVADDLVKAAEQVFGADGTGDADLAKRKLDEALKLVPGHPGATALLPKVAAALAAKANAANRAEATAAREARLQKARVLATEGKRLYDSGQVGPAREKLYASLKLDPENPEPHRTLGKIFNREDQVDKVRYHLQRYLDLGGADGDFKVREWLKSHPK